MTEKRAKFIHNKAVLKQTTPQAYKNAGFKVAEHDEGARQNGYRLLQCDYVKNEIAKIENLENQILKAEIKQNVDTILAELDDIKLKALEKSDLSNALAAIIAKGKTTRIQAFSDNININDGVAEAINLAQRNHLKLISSHTLSSTLLEDLHNVDGGSKEIVPT
jgi:hypothetical protein